MTLARLVPMLLLASQLGCDAEKDPEPDQRVSVTSAYTGPIKLKFDYSGVEVALIALERNRLSDPSIDSLLAIAPARAALLENPARFVPGVTEDKLRSELKHFAINKQSFSQETANLFQLGDVWKQRKSIRDLLARFHSTESTAVPQILQQLDRYSPDVGPLTVTVYFVAGGVSDGFVFDSLRTNVYANLARANGDFDGVLSNLSHETYHVIQKEAQRRIPSLRLFADSEASVPADQRLLARTLAEGTAFFVTESTRKSRKTEKNFALFDSILAELLDRKADWNKVELEGFSNDAPFYAVGFEMAKAIDRYCGNDCIRSAFSKEPIEFFRQYVSLYKAHPEIAGRFSPRTEAFLAGNAR